MNVLILGANSAIAKETARLMAQKNYSLYLVSKNETTLANLASDLKLRSAQSICTRALDLSDISLHQELIDGVLNSFSNKIDIVLLAHGVLGDQAEFESDYQKLRQMFDINYLSHASLLNILANHFAKQQSGQIVGISSIAGDRGRAKNYFYGASKAALSETLSGLRQRMLKHNVNVITVKPGFVDTPMTAHLDKGLLFVKPDTIAKIIMNAIKKRKEVVYTPWFWYFIMLIINHIPEKIFKKLKF